MPTNNTIRPTKKSIGAQLNDIGFRVVLIPFFGIVIPLATGMMKGITWNTWLFKVSFLYTIGIAFVIWQGNRYLLFTLRSYFDWFNRPIRKILALAFAVPFYTVPVSMLLLTAWYHVFAEGRVNWEVVITSTLIILVCVIFIVHVYETVFLVKEAENDRIRHEQLERARVEAELEALKNQIDPHFIFNSLNTLSHLIDDNRDKAKLFNDNLADVYRYILQNKGRDLVFLREELHFLEDYFSLLKIRFEKAVMLLIDVEETVKDLYLIPPISLQILMENAIKHNEFSDAAPMRIFVSLTPRGLEVKNVMKKKLLRKPASGIGLHNLNERYKLTTDRSMQVSETGSWFTVVLPVLKIE